jgi:DNA processing protein
LVESLAKEVDDLCIVSGLAYGTDSACHRAALANNVCTVAVTPSALPNIVPTAHLTLAREIIKAGGAIVSELSSQSRNNGSHFISRNRIIAGLSLGTIVVESPASSGSLSTADIADSYGRTVMAIPGRLTDTSSFGTNNLIRSGKARLVLTADDIIEDVGLRRKSISEETAEDNTHKAELSDHEQRVIDAFRGQGILDWSELLEGTQLTMGELSMVIMDLEFKGLVRALPGKRYEAI